MSDPVRALCEQSLGDEWKIEGAFIREQFMARALLVAWGTLRDSECTYELCGMDPSVLCNRCNGVRRILAIVREET